MQRTGVVEGSVLEDQTTKVTVSGDDVVSLFFLTKLITVVLGLTFGGLTNQRRGNQRTVHCAEQGSAEHTCYAEHVEGVHQNVVLCLEHQHVVKSTRDTKRHSVRERTLTERGRPGRQQMLQRQVRCKQHRSKGAYPDDKTVPTHDPCKHRYR